MTMKLTGFAITKTILAFAQLLVVTVAVGSGLVVSAQTQQTEEQPGDRHICPVEAIRNGTCDPNPGKGKNPTPGKPQGPVINVPRRQPQYKRVAKQTNTSAACNSRVKATKPQTTKTTVACEAPSQSSRREDLPISSQKVGITIWRIRKLQRGYTGARILWHPEQANIPVEYQAERIQGDPVLAYGDKVRLGIESPRDGYLYVFDRELYDDGSLSAAYLIFPTTRLNEGNNRIRANRPIELPSLTDNPFYFEAKKIGLDPNKMLVGEVLSIAITDKPISRLTEFGRNAMRIATADMDSLETLYSGRAEVFELEDGVGQPYSNAERDAAATGARLLTHNDPVPQTFYLVEDKRTGGLLVTLALKYEESRKRYAHQH
jgi:hypothetical protein